MKKLLALVAILPAISLPGPCFGVDWARDRIYTSSLYGAGNVILGIGYRCTNSVKVSIEGMYSIVEAFNNGKLRGATLVNLHYHYKSANTDLTPYVNAGVGAAFEYAADQDGKNRMQYGLSYKISSGLDLPLSSRTNVFAGYRLLKEYEGYNHGIELGINVNF